MRYINGVLIEPQLKTEDAQLEEHGAITCLDNDRWALASKTVPVVYLVNKTLIVSSCILKMPESKETAVCCGMVASLDNTRLFLLYCYPNGKMFILTCLIKNDTIIHLKDVILPLPQGMSDTTIGETVAYWNQDGTVQDGLGLSKFTDGSSALTYAKNFPIGPVLLRYKPWIGSDGTKLIIGVNHMQVVSMLIKNDVTFLDLNEFKRKVAVLKNVKYNEFEWWLSRRVKKFVHKTEQCEGLLECSDCGFELSCKETQRQHGTRRIRPIWDENGNPIIEEREYDEVIANTTMSTAILISSLVVMDYTTGLVEGITHIGASRFGMYKPNNDVSHIIVGLDCYDGNIDVAFGTYNKSIPPDMLYWGTSPLVMSDTTQLSFYAFLQWWDTHHLKSDLFNNVYSYFDIGKILATSVGTFKLNDLIVSEDICVTNNKIDYSVAKPGVPFTNVDGITDITSSNYKNITYVAYDNKVIKYTAVYYEITSFHEGKLLGTRPDIVIGRVLKGLPKIVMCEFKNTDKIFALYNTVLTIIPDNNYPYYEYCMFSLDGISWDYSITLPVVAPETVTTFYTKVHTASNITDPKPVQFSIDYERGIM